MRFSFVLLLVLAACRNTPTQQVQTPASESPAATDSLIVAEMADTLPLAAAPDYDTTEWTDIGLAEPSIVLDLKYATEDNFVQSKMYECGRCFLRKPVAAAVITAHRQLQQQGLGLKMYDCFRPRPVQWDLWKKVPDPRYVADPREGSMHNRGCAVDLTVVKTNGEELDMGTKFDFFGKEAWHEYRNLPEAVLANRLLLKKAMEQQGLHAIRTEWWHYFWDGQNFELSDMLWKCY